MSDTQTTPAKSTPQESISSASQPWALRMLLAALVIVYVVLWVGSVGSRFMYDIAPREWPWVTPVFLTLASLIVIITTNRRNLSDLLIVGGLGFLAEVIGVRLKLPFGDYRYTEVLLPHLLDVPLVMICLWIVLFAYVKQMLLPFRFPLWVASLIAASWMTSIDAVIDPPASRPLAFWRWQESGSYFGVPAKNYIGWFLISLILFNIVRGEWQKNRWAHYTGMSIILFFALIALAHKMILVFIFGVILFAIDLMVIYAKREGEKKANAAVEP